MRRPLTSQKSLPFVYKFVDKRNPLVYTTVDINGSDKMTILELGKLTDAEARQYLENLLWPNGPICPHCKSDDCTRLHGKAHRPGCVQCNDCRKQFSVTVGTVMERSKVSLSRWLMAFHLMCSSKKGFSALQLQRNLELGSYKTAWFMFHRVRHAMEFGPLAVAFSGTVEVDESYVGGKPRKQNKLGVPAGHKPGTRGPGRGTKKAPIIVLVERDGRARSKPIERVDTETLHKEILCLADQGAAILTDEWKSYRGIGKYFEGGHHTVHHSNYEYARRTEDGFSVNVNTAESFFALVKRGHYGVYHQMSKKHLHRYCAEFEFRWNHRKTNDSARTEAALKQVQGKRLMYETPNQ
jgi:transposase-like protein